MSRWRWSAVAVVAVVALLLPVAPAWVPVSATDAPATRVVERMRASTDVGWSGDVRTRGTLQLPDTDSFAGVARLLGEETDVRAWWRDPEHWRVDRVRQTGETDLVRNADQLTSWVFESSTVTVSPYSSVRLPDVSDLLPNRLAERLLDGATPAEVSRIDARRVAGREADGVRLRPSDERTTIGRADLWADRETGLPLRVDVYSAGSGRLLLTSEVDRVDLERPTADQVRFEPPSDARFRARDAVDLAAGANVFAPFQLPDAVGGLDRRGDPAEAGAVGIYGRGPTAFVAIPLRRSVAGRVRDQLMTAAAAESTDAGTTLTVGPLSVLLTDRRSGPGRFLLAGTVTPDTLAAAVDDLRSGVVVR